MKITELISRKILVLDGAMGTMLQAQGLTDSDFNRGIFQNHPVPLKGDNDVLCLTRPDAVRRVHDAYLNAGADIIETNTFNANAVSQGDYGLPDRVYDLAFAGAAVAREAADEATRKTPGKPRFVAGSVGPTGRTASMSPSVDDPSARNITFDELAATYRDQIRGLLDGGADVILLETVFDTLNCKAAIYAFGGVLNDFPAYASVPLMISATLSDASGRMLAGQSAEAFLNSVLHAPNLMTVGFNCALGAEEMRPHIAELSAKSPTFISAHPNAGLPDMFGKYSQTPEMMAKVIRSFAASGYVNIVGGCCGTTPEHIAAIAKAVENLAPRVPPSIRPVLRLSGLDAFNAENCNFINVGERTNVSGSKKFLNVIKAGDMPEAMEIARRQIESGAAVIDINTDDAMIDSETMMRKFLLTAAAEPDIARVPVMVDSSDWKIVRSALKCLQGRGIVNSISLKEGEEPFLEKAREIRRLGAAVLVMAFDEKGQADTCSRRLEVLDRSFRLLTEKAGIPPQDIVFDPNVFAVATGMREHDNYAKDFIDTVRELRRRYPLCNISGGISNVSFAFRGNETVRRAIHTVFLKHAIDAGLTMGIVNASQLGIYSELEPELRAAAEAVVLNTSPDAAETLLAVASRISSPEKTERAKTDDWRTKPLAERIRLSLVKGDDSHAESDMAEALAEYPSPMKIVEGPLMDGMADVGRLFSSGQMFLPQVVKSARVMKRSVTCLLPAVEKADAANPDSGDGKKACTVVLATVKGDVHDIGKNIVSVVLQCNRCRVIDLGVMVPAKTIVDSAVENHADVIGLSGLITPSLAEMANVASELENRGLRIPLLVGGAAASLLHTALKLQPEYSAPVLYASDASACVPIVSNLMNPAKAEAFLKTVREKYEELSRVAGNRISDAVSLEEARRNAVPSRFANEVPSKPGVHDFELVLNAVLPYLDWEGLIKSWDMPRSCCCSSDFIADAKLILSKSKMSVRCAVGIFPANSAEDDSILVYSDESRTRVRAKIPCGRSLAKGRNGSVSDWLTRCDSGVPDWLGMFVVSVSGADSEAEAYRRSGDEYSALLTQTLATRLAEAAAELVHSRIRREFWGYEREEKPTVDEMLHGVYRGIRPAPGYPDLPDHSLKRVLFDLLEAEARTGVTLTESFMMIPQASVCALAIANPSAHYGSSRL